MISYHNGNVLDSDCDIICHQVNLQGVMGGGLAKQIADRFPRCEEQYQDIIKQFDMRGDVHFFCYHGKGYGRYIANCFSQNENFETNYSWVKKCFDKVLKFAKSFGWKTVAVPKNYGCGIAKGDWNKVEKILKDVFENDVDVEFQIWELGGLK